MPSPEIYVGLIRSTLDEVYGYKAAQPSSFFILQWTRTGLVLCTVRLCGAGWNLGGVLARHRSSKWGKPFKKPHRASALFIPQEYAASATPCQSLRYRRQGCCPWRSTSSVTWKQVRLPSVRNYNPHLSTSPRATSQLPSSPHRNAIEGVKAADA